MGRIRTVKPELLAAERFATLTDAAARLFIALYSLADDLGNCPAGPTYLRGQVFYGRPRAPTVIGRLLGELERARLVDLYTVDGASFLSIVGWREKETPTHQRIDKPQAPQFPLPSGVRSWSEFPERSRTDPIRSDPKRVDPKGDDAIRGDPIRSDPAPGPSFRSAPDPAGLRPPEGGKADEDDEEQMKRLHDRVTEALGSALRRRDPRGFLAIERPFARSIWDVFAVNANEVDPLAVDWDYSATRAGRNYECDEEATNRTEPVQKKVVNFHERATWSFVLAELLKEQQQ